MKKRMLLTVLSALTVLMLISSIVVKSYASLTDDKSDVQNKINEAKNALNDISDDKDEAETELQKITTQVTEAQKQLDTLAAQIDELNDTIDEKQKEIEDEEAEIEKTDNLLKERMVALYEIGETSYLDVLFNSENILDFLSNYSMIQQIVETDSALIDELEAKKEQLQKDKDNGGGIIHPGHLTGRQRLPHYGRIADGIHLLQQVTDDNGQRKGQDRLPGGALCQVPRLKKPPQGKLGCFLIHILHSTGRSPAFRIFIPLTIPLTN